MDLQSGIAISTIQQHQQQQYTTDQPSISPTSNSNYLPRYLLGGGTPQGNTPSRYHQNTGHPTRRNLSREKSTLTNKDSSSHRNAPWVTGKGNGSGGLGLTKDKTFAPPVEGLYDDESADKKYSTPNSMYQNQTSSKINRLEDSFLNGKRESSYGHLMRSDNLNESQTSEFMNATRTSIYDSTGVLGQSFASQVSSPTQIDPFYTQGEEITSDDVFDECWVTIFGFPPSAATYILEQFSHYGVIVKHVMLANSNWMHIQYQFKIQAKKAISKSGRIFGNGIMVGVRPCIDKIAIIGNQEMSSTIQSPDPVNSNISTPKSAAGIRPLVATYSAVNNQNKVSAEVDTPQKNDGLIAKVMEYMFGW
ncbi:Nucleoporin NUP53 [Trichoplax sp. H2]|nr:Nucleoporin NUP53 [Trichoplax sp. H2]|eukprot:RDD44976.1 Nucleoporin NUP53 [Trichoplax sp. H2]